MKKKINIKKERNFSFINDSLSLPLLGTANGHDASNNEHAGHQEPFDEEENEGKHHWCLVTVVVTLLVFIRPTGVGREHNYGALQL